MAEHRWSEYETICLLAAMIYASTRDTGTLLGVIDQQHIMPSLDWNQVLVPPGRTVAQCRNIVDQLMNQSMGRPQQLTQGPTPHGPRYPLPPQSPSAPAGEPAGRKRPLDTTASTLRNIQPRPQTGGGRAHWNAAPSPPTEEPARKKPRGRPTNAVRAEREAAAAAALAAGQGSAGATAATRSGPSAARRMPTTGRTAPSVNPQRIELPTTAFPTLSSGSAFAEPSSSSRSPYPAPAFTPRVPIDSLVTPNAPKSAHDSSSSSGKRRRGPSTRSNPGDQPDSEAEQREAERARSPSERWAPRETREPDDNSATAAMAGYREDQQEMAQQQQRDLAEGRGVRMSSQPRWQSTPRTEGSEGN